MRVGIIGLTAMALAGATTTLAADGSSDDSGRPPWAGEGQPLLFEAGAFASLAVGGQFRVEDAAARGTGTDSRATLADHGAFAVTVDLRSADNAQYELFYSREGTDLRGNASVTRTGVTVEYLHIGGNLLLNDEPRIKPYIAGGLGITRFTPGEEGSTDTQFSVSLGLGLKWPVTRNFSLRVEGRGFLTLVSSDTAVFCRSDQSGLLCQIRGSGQTFLQGQFLAGATFAF